MTTIPDHYAALGIDPTADQEVITAAYRALAKKFHPDTGTVGGTASAERFDQIQQAYEVLRTPESRHAYDLELLAATEAELQAHIASKRRVAVREREREAERAAAPDLGDIRPEPAEPPRAGPPPGKRKQRSLFPFVVPLLLVAMVGGAAAWMFLPTGPDAPPLPGVEKQDVAEAPSAPVPQPTAAPKADAPAPQPQSDSAKSSQPVFGSAAVDGAPEVKQAAATPEPASAPATPPVDGAATPAFGSSAGEPGTGADGAAAAAPQDPEAPAAPLEAAPPPLPKAKPAQPVKQAQKPAAAKPAQKQAQPVQKKPSQQPRARLAYQDPPAYFPEPDGYPPPPPGMEPPGFEPDYPPSAYEADGMPPPGFRPPGGGPYRLVIFERQPGRQATAWSAGVVFKSMGKCTRQGVKAVLRRTAGMDPYAENVRIWYECQQLSQR